MRTRIAAARRRLAGSLWCVAGHALDEAEALPPDTLARAAADLRAALWGALAQLVDTTPWRLILLAYAIAVLTIALAGTR